MTFALHCIGEVSMNDSVSRTGPKFGWYGNDAGWNGRWSLEMELEKMKFERVCPALRGRERNRMPRKARVSGQMKALTAARRTLHGIKFDKFWDRVIQRVTPKADANERIRARSLAKAGHHVLR